MDHFLDRILDAAPNYGVLIAQFEKLLSESGPLGSFNDTIEKGFIFWPHNHGYANFWEFRTKYGIYSLAKKALTPHLKVTKEEFVYYLEYLLNIIEIPKYRMDRYIFPYNEAVIIRFLHRVIEDIDCKTVSSEQGVYVVPQNSKIEIAQKITGDKYDLDKDLYLFTHSSVKSNLIKKADILCRIYKYLEGIRPRAKSYGYDNIFGDISKLMDGLDIRHAPKKKEEEILSEMPKDEVVQWYDQLFEMCLSLIILVNYAEKRRDIKELKNALG